MVEGWMVEGWMVDERNAWRVGWLVIGDGEIEWGFGGF